MKNSANHSLWLRNAKRLVSMVLSSESTGMSAFCAEGPVPQHSHAHTPDQVLWENGTHIPETRGKQAACSVPVPLSTGRLPLSLPHAQHRRKGWQHANLLIKEALTFNFTNGALFHKEQREFISNRALEAHSPACFFWRSYNYTPDF